jgi:hypothetical protein
MPAPAYPRLGPFPARLEMTVWIYDQSEELKVFAAEDAARKWIDENDPEGVAFEYPVIGTFAG